MSTCWQLPAQGVIPRKFLVERVTFALEPTAGPVAHVHVEIVAAPITGTVQRGVEMFVARIKMIRFRGKARRVPSGKIGFQETFRFLHHVFRDGFRHQQRVAFERGGQRSLPRAELPSQRGRARCPHRAGMWQNVVRIPTPHPRRARDSAPSRRVTPLLGSLFHPVFEIERL